MANGPIRLLLCDCAGTFAPDAGRLGDATGMACDTVHTGLCRREAGAAAEALAAGGRVVVACQQEAQTFTDIAAERGADDRLIAVDIRDRAGWSESEPRDQQPKMAALLAEGALPAPALPTMDVTSEGVALVYGRGQQAVDAGLRLAPTLSVTVMLAEPEEVTLPAGAEVDVVTGRIGSLSGALGRFEMRVDAFAELLPQGRGARRFGPARDGATSSCDLVVDLSGATPLVPAHEKRDGYLRADPRDPIAVERALFDAAQLVGGFEKPLHIRFEAPLCAHSRASKPACSRCLDVCPTGAIRPDGDHVAIDPHVCAGCGACSAVCPTGAAATEEPPVQHLFRRMRTLAETYRKAGGREPVLLVHDAEHGAEMIRLAARFGRGLPAPVIPLEIQALASFGHAEMLTALALGFHRVVVLPGPKTDVETIGRQRALAGAIIEGTGVAGERIEMLDAADPDAMSDALYAAQTPPHDVTPILPLGGRREATRLAAKALAANAEPQVPLPEGAPYGAVLVDTDACTLCLACAGLCPTGALGDNPDRPELSFREEACVQCGLCANVCPESAIRLEPRLDLSDAALRPRTLHEEEPFHCISCGVPFGVKSTIERITEKLSGAHPMFTNSDNAKLIQMCDDCRVRAQYHADAAPFAAGPRPPVRTTDDYRD